MLGKFAAFALSVGLFLTLSAVGQPPPFGPKGGKGGFKGGPKGAKGATERLLDDLTLTAAQKEKARAVLRAYDDKVREFTRQARQELIEQMKDIVPADDLKTFKAELEQVPLLAAVTPGPRGVAVEDLVERVMSYDKDGDGKVTRDELPARMHNLIDQGDRNGDGALDRDEVERLAARNNPPGPPRGPGGPRGGPPGGPGGGPPRRGPGGE
jgi:hypothetical protein